MAAPLDYTTICSLDGYVADAAGEFGWAEPDEEVHAFVNARERELGTYLYGRRLDEIMRVRAQEPLPFGGNPVVDEYAGVWRAADKIVWSDDVRLDLQLRETQRFAGGTVFVSYAVR